MGLPVYEMLMSGFARYNGMDDVVVVEKHHKTVIAMAQWTGMHAELEALLDAGAFQVRHARCSACVHLRVAAMSLIGGTGQQELPAAEAQAAINQVTESHLGPQPGNIKDTSFPDPVKVQRPRADPAWPWPPCFISQPLREGVIVPCEHSPLPGQEQKKLGGFARSACAK